MKRIYKASYSYRTRNPGIEMKDNFIVEASNFDEAVRKAKVYLDTCIFASDKNLEGVELLGEIVSR